MAAARRRRAAAPWRGPAPCGRPRCAYPGPPLPRAPLVVPLPRRYLPLVEAIQANMAGSGKDVYVTVLEGCGQRKILSQFLLK